LLAGLVVALALIPEAIAFSIIHLDSKAPQSEGTWRPPCRAPPQRGLFDETG